MSLGHAGACSRLARAAALGVALLGCHLAKETLAWVGISSPQSACSIFVSHCRPYSRTPERMLRRAQGRDPFTVLGVESSATRDEVKKAFRERIRKAHPDAGGSTEEFKQVREAYQEALTRVGFHVSGDDSRTGEGAARTNAQGWSIRDFYKWRREQVQQEKHVWEQDAEARSQHWWSSKGTRAQQRDRAATAAEEPPKTVRAQNPRMRREDRLRKKQKLQERQDESVMEWDAFLKRTKNGKDKDTFGQQKRTRPARGGPSTNDDKVVTHRSIATFEGQKRVPVFQDKGGTCYYVSPTTQRKVVLPKDRKSVV